MRSSGRKAHREGWRGVGREEGRGGCTMGTEEWEGACVCWDGRDKGTRWW